MMPKSKICTKCKVEKPLDEFHKRKIGKFGRQPRCKVCVAKYYGENREKILEQSRRYYEENREKILETNRQYRDKYQKN